MTDSAGTPQRALPVGTGASLLAVVAGALLLCSQLTLIDIAPAFFPRSVRDLDGIQLADRELRLIGVVWPTIALGLAVYAGLRRSAMAISTGIGFLTLTASYGVALLYSYVDDYGFGPPPEADPARQTVLIVGAVSIALIALAIWWIVELARCSAARLRSLVPVAAAVSALTMSLGASIVAALGDNRDVDLPLFPALISLLFLPIATAALVTASRAGLVLAVAVSVARLSATFDLVAIRGASLSVVVDTLADRLALIGIVLAMLGASAGLLPPRAVLRSAVDSFRAKLTLADEWDD